MDFYKPGDSPAKVLHTSSKVLLDGAPVDVTDPFCDLPTKADFKILMTELKFELQKETQPLRDGLAALQVGGRRQKTMEAENKIVLLEGQRADTEAQDCDLKIRKTR